ncbi:MAG TPA: hypothetical protein VFQ85_10715 [Mycobacteriales bacterium]|jgi:hypothetical protein|nr:hypothetical protein [Mycobacteriales bacterium]
MRRFRTAALAVLAAVAVAAPPSYAAAPGPARPLAWTDPAGDALVPHGSLDIVGVTVRTTGRVVRRAYRPERLVVTLRVADAVVAPAGVTYHVRATIPDCGDLDLVYTPGSIYSVAGSNAWAFGECAVLRPTVAGTTVYVTPVRATVAGATVTWTVPLDLVDVEAGTEFTAVEARTEVCEPVFGYFGNGVAVSDGASTTRRWRAG